MMNVCQRCQTKYQVSKSNSALRLTWCGLICEVAELGYSLSAWERQPVIKRRTIPLPEEITKGVSVEL